MRPGSYEEWIRLYDTITSAERAALRAEQERLPRQPLFSILLPVYNPELRWLEEAIDSVRAQTYSRWELCIADDASTLPGVRSLLKETAKNDPRIRLVFRATNGHISAATNSALALAMGEWCGLFDQDDLLAPQALSLVAREVNANPAAGLIYSDEDFVDVSGARSNPFIKPDWNPELFLGQNYVNHFGVYRTELLREIGGFREGFEGSQDYDLVLRCVEQLHRGQIRHIPRILYHWRMVPGSLAATRDAKPYAKDAARRALSEHVQRAGLAASVAACPENVESHRVTFAVPQPAPLVSLVRHGRAADGTYRSYGTYPSYELLEATDAGGLIRAVAEARGGVLVFLERSVEITEPGWLEELVGQAMRDEVGVVGARIWSLDGRLRHSGFVLGLGGVVGDGHAGLPRGHPGFFNRTLLQRNCSAISAECLAVRTSIFRELGGFDAVNLTRCFHDVDFCLRAGELGLQVIWTPYVNPIQQRNESAREEMDPADEEYMRRRWGAKLEADPFYSPNLTLEPPAFELAFPPRWQR